MEQDRAALMDDDAWAFAPDDLGGEILGDDDYN